jgi:ATP diphosphatase
MSEKSVAAGFAWEDARGALAKVREELAELEEAFAVSSGAELSAEVRTRIEDELGDVLMAAAFFGQYIGLDAERLCNRALSRYETRFRHMEREIEGDLKQRSLKELMQAWERAKLETAASADTKPTDEMEAT